MAQRQFITNVKPQVNAKAEAFAADFIELLKKHDIDPSLVKLTVDDQEVEAEPQEPATNAENGGLSFELPGGEQGRTTTNTAADTLSFDLPGGA